MYYPLFVIILSELFFFALNSVVCMKTFLDKAVPLVTFGNVATKHAFVTALLDPFFDSFIFVLFLLML